MIKQFKEQLNAWGKSKIPFVFLIDFECEKPICWKIQDCAPSFYYNFQGISNIPSSNRNIKNIRLKKIQ